jgi:2-oxoglutarate ferredoxin oxidoreductase subunit beta
MTKLEDLNTPNLPTWCPGCGNFGLWGAFKNAATAEGWDNTNSALVAGIGCHGHVLNYTKISSMEGLHGRAIPVATGIKLANHKLNVFVFTGDGDGLGEGGNHFIHACRRNHNITVIIHNNQIYGLTTGQTSPLTPFGYKTKSTPEGNPDHPINPLALAIASGATFVARGFAGDLPKLTELFIQANKHEGISIVEVLQPCVTFNKECSFPYYRENCYYLENHDAKNKEAAFAKTLEFGPKKIPLGIFYQVENPSYESEIPQIKDKPLVSTPPSKKDLTDIFKKYS